MSHESGCPCNGFGGCYAACECTQIIQRRHAVALEENTAALRRAEENRGAFGDTDEITEIRQLIENLDARIRRLEEGEGKP